MAIDTNYGREAARNLGDVGKIESSGLRSVQTCQYI